MSDGDTVVACQGAIPLLALSPSKHAKSTRGSFDFQPYVWPAPVPELELAIASVRSRVSGCRIGRGLRFDQRATTRARKGGSMQHPLDRDSIAGTSVRGMFGNYMALLCCS